MVSALLPRRALTTESPLRSAAAVGFSVASAVAAGLAIVYGLAVVASAVVLLFVGFLVGLRNWRWSIYGLLAYLPLSGIPVLLAYPHTAAPTLLKDGLFVVPAYVGFLASRLARGQSVETKGAPTVVLGLFALLVTLQVFNPGLPSVLVGVVGLKVWLFYVPLLFLGYHLVSRRTDLDRVLRLMALGAVIPSVIGIAEAVLIARGHAGDVYRFYGAAAGAATQNFAETAYAGGGTLRRVPSTFTFVTQYYVFATSMVAVTYAWWRGGGSSRAKPIRALLWLLALLAALLSGARGAFLFVPLLVVFTFVLERGLARLPVARIVTIGAVFFVAAGVLGAHAGTILSHTVGVGQSETPLTVYGLDRAVRHAPLGAGTGVGTSAARYVLPSSDVALIGGQESWYLKAAVELGVAGLTLLVLLVGALIVHGRRCHRQLHDPGLRAVSASLLALLIWHAINGFKGSYIDIDPANVYFWLLAGVLFKLPVLASHEASAFEHPAELPS